MNKPNISITAIFQLIKFFASWKVEEVAREIGFTKREKGLNANTFLKAFTAGIWGLHEITLDLLAGECCKFQRGLTLTKQALFKRLENGSVLLKNLLALAVTYAARHSITTDVVTVLKQFKNVYLCDSTLLDLPDKLESIYKGIGGQNPKSSLKIQVIFSILDKKFKSIELWPARGNDIKYNPNIIKNLSEGDLVIYDLGYFSMATFKEIVKKGAHFLSRLKIDTCMYKEVKSKHKKVTLLEILSKSNGVVDEYFYIGARTSVRTEVRLVAMRLPDDVVNERRRKAEKKARKKGKTLKKEEIELLAWNILVTDITGDILSLETVLHLYKIRWQVELVFKNWKSNFNIGKIGQAGDNYFHCILYGKLILITLMTAIYSNAFYMVYHHRGRILSSLKFFKTLREYLDDLKESIGDALRGTKKLYWLFEKVIKRSLTDKRKRKTTEQALGNYTLPLVVLQNVG